MTSKRVRYAIRMPSSQSAKGTSGLRNIPHLDILLAILDEMKTPSFRESINTSETIYSENNEDY